MLMANVGNLPNLGIGTTAISGNQVSQQSNGTETFIPSKLFIGGLSYDTTDDSLAQYFAQFGQVAQAIVLRDPVTSHSRGFGFVTYADEFGAKRALSGGRNHVVDGRKVEAKIAFPRNSMPVMPQMGQMQSAIPGPGAQNQGANVGGHFRGSGPGPVGHLNEMYMNNMMNSQMMNSQNVPMNQMGGMNGMYPPYGMNGLYNQPGYGNGSGSGSQQFHGAGGVNDLGQNQIPYGNQRFVDSPTNGFGMAPSPAPGFEMRRHSLKEPRPRVQQFDEVDTITARVNTLRVNSVHSAHSSRSIHSAHSGLSHDDEEQDHPGSNRDLRRPTYPIQPSHHDLVNARKLSMPQMRLQQTLGRPSASGNLSPSTPMSMSLSQYDLVDALGSDYEQSALDVNKLFVGGLSFATTHDSLLHCFEMFGNVLSAEVMYDRMTKQPRGFGFVVFKEFASIRKVFEYKKFNPIIVDNSEVVLKLCKPKTDIPPGLGIEDVPTIWDDMGDHMNQKHLLRSQTMPLDYDIHTETIIAQSPSMKEMKHRLSRISDAGVPSTSTLRSVPMYRSNSLTNDMFVPVNDIDNLSEVSSVHTSNAAKMLMKNEKMRSLSFTNSKLNTLQNEQEFEDVDNDLYDNVVRRSSSFITSNDYEANNSAAKLWRD